MKFFIIIAAMMTAAGVASAACKEGSKGWVTVRDNINDHSRTEMRICRNGTYMTDEERAAYIYNPRTGCVEGSRGWVTLHDENDHSYTEARTCVNGSYMTPEERAAYVRVPKNRCKEGSRRIESVFNNINDSYENVTMVCRSGKWIRAR